VASEKKVGSAPRQRAVGSGSYLLQVLPVRPYVRAITGDWSLMTARRKARGAGLYSTAAMERVAWTGRGSCRSAEPVVLPLSFSLCGCIRTGYIRTAGCWKPGAK
jgi:hypothetical protein